MAASDFLQELRLEQKFLDFLLSLVPRDDRATDLTRLPNTLRSEALAMGLPPFLDGVNALKWIFTEQDWAARMHKGCIEFVAMDNRAKISPSDTFAVGSRPGSQINAEAIPVPPYHGSGWVLVFDYGLFNFTGNLARLLTLRMPPTLRKRIARAGQPADMTVSWPARIFARLRWSQEIAALNAVPFWQIIVEFVGALHAYESLGVSALSLLPTLQYVPARPGIGHPLECSGRIADASLEFVILHELSHVLLGHTTSTGSISQEQEFAADCKALRLLVEGRRTNPEAAALGYAGAVFLLRLTQYLESFDEGWRPATHPRAQARIDALRKVLDEINREERLPARCMHELSDGIDNVLQDLWNQSAGFRLALRQGRATDVFETLLDASARHEDDKKFVGQILRWMAFSAPDRLCSRIAREKAKLERDADSSPTCIARLRIIEATFALLSKEPYTREQMMLHYRQYSS